MYIFVSVYGFANRPFSIGKKYYNQGSEIAITSEMPIPVFPCQRLLADFFASCHFRFRLLGRELGYDGPLYDGLLAMTDHRLGLSPIHAYKVCVICT